MIHSNISVIFSLDHIPDDWCETFEKATEDEDFMKNQFNEFMKSV